MTWNNEPPPASEPAPLENRSYASPLPPQTSPYSTTPPPTQAWPPQDTTGVWPPPVYAQTEPPRYFPFTFLYERVEGSVSDIREGRVAIDPGGIIVDGKALPRAEIYQPIMIVTLFLYGSFILAYLIMRYACLGGQTLAIAWNTVQSVTLQPKKRKACITYYAPNYKGDVKTHSLTMKFRKGDYDELLQSLERHAPGFARPGKIRAAYSPVVIVWMTCVLIDIVIIIAAAIRGAHHP